MWEWEKRIARRPLLGAIVYGAMWAVVSTGLMALIGQLEPLLQVP